MVGIRLYMPTDFALVEAWWREHHGNDFRPSYVPLAAFIVQVDGEDVGFFGVSPMTPAFCYLSFPLINPLAPKHLRDISIDAMIDYAKIWAAQNDYPVLWISMRGEKFLNRLRDKGFITGEQGNTHMFCKVGEVA